MILVIYFISSSASEMPVSSEHLLLDSMPSETTARLMYKQERASLQFSSL